MYRNLIREGVCSRVSMNKEPTLYACGWEDDLSCQGAFFNAFSELVTGDGFGNRAAIHGHSPASSYTAAYMRRRSQARQESERVWRMMLQGARGKVT